MGWFVIFNDEDCNEECGVVGDSGLDIFGLAVEMTIKVYKKEVGREPTRLELSYMLDMVVGQYELEEK